MQLHSLCTTNFQTLDMFIANFRCKTHDYAQISPKINRNICFFIYFYKKYMHSKQKNLF